MTEYLAALYHRLTLSTDDGSHYYMKASVSRQVILGSPVSLYQCIPKDQWVYPCLYGGWPGYITVCMGCIGAAPTQQFVPPQERS